jgi:hypothetical protein
MRHSSSGLAWVGLIAGSEWGLLVLCVCVCVDVDVWMCVDVCVCVKEIYKKVSSMFPKDPPPLSHAHTRRRRSA